MNCHNWCTFKSTIIMVVFLYIRIFFTFLSKKSDCGKIWPKNKWVQLFHEMHSTALSDKKTKEVLTYRSRAQCAVYCLSNSLSFYVLQGLVS